MIAAVVLMGTVSAARAEVDKATLSQFTEDQREFLGRLGNAFATARHCNFGLNSTAIRVAGRAVFPASQITVNQAMDVMFVVDGFSAIADDVIFPDAKPAAKAVKCREMLRYYGPKGTTIPDLLEP